MFHYLSSLEAIFIHSMVDVPGQMLPDADGLNFGPKYRKFPIQTSKLPMDLRLQKEVQQAQERKEKKCMNENVSTIR